MHIISLKDIWLAVVTQCAQSYARKANHMEIIDVN